MPPRVDSPPHLRPAVTTAFATMDTNNEFPFFDDGDVVIILTEDYKYRLHSSVLKNASAIMHDLLDEDYIPLKALQNGLTAVHKLVLIENPHRLSNNGVAIDYVLETVPLDGYGREVGNESSSFRCEDKEYVVWYPQVILAFDAVVRAIYHEPINIGNAQKDDFTDLLSFALSVTTVAEYLECTHIITQAIESTLLATGQELYHAISTNPVAWLEFATRIQSKAIFKEALIHAAGQFYTPLVQGSIKKLPQAVLEIVKNKADAIKESVRKAEEAFVSYYPRMLMRSRKSRLDARESVSRATYSNDILMWIALNIFRHWCGNQLVKDLSHHAVDMGWAFIKAINTGDEEYLTQQELNEGFHVRFPMSAKASLCVYHRLGEIKQVVKQWTFPLMQNRSQLDQTANQTEYFLHIEVDEKDYPWAQQVDDDGDLLNCMEDVDNVHKSIEGAYEDNVGEAPLTLDNEVMDEIERLDGRAYIDAICEEQMPIEYDDNLDGFPINFDNDSVLMDDDIDGVPMDEDSDGDGKDVPWKGKQPVRDSGEEDQGSAAQHLLALGCNEQDTRAAHGRQDRARAARAPARPHRFPSLSRGDTEPLEPWVYEQALEESRSARQRFEDHRLNRDLSNNTHNTFN